MILIWWAGHPFEDVTGMPRRLTTSGIRPHAYSRDCKERYTVPPPARDLYQPAPGISRTLATILRICPQRSSAWAVRSAFFLSVEAHRVVAMGSGTVADDLCFVNHDRDVSAGVMHDETCRRAGSSMRSRNSRFFFVPPAERA